MEVKVNLDMGMVLRIMTERRKEIMTEVKLGRKT